MQDHKKYSIASIVQIADRAAQMVEEVRERMLAPRAQKTSPQFSLTQVAAMCGTEKGSLAYRAHKGEVPTGRMNETGSRREFSLAEARACVKLYRHGKLRPAGKRAVTIAIGNFKGGVSKTTTAMTLAQGLSLKGHRVLAVDLDPQGSLTTLFGLLPDAEVDESKTFAPLAYGVESSIRGSIQATYWDGIDLVAASPTLFGAEFALPAQQVRDPKFRFWDVLNLGLEDVRDEYDVIVIDTAPALSYLTINAFLAADGLVVPVPPSALDFASSASFWGLFSDLASNLVKVAGIEKSFDFVNVLLSRVDSSDAASAAVRQWITTTYGENMLLVEIPKTAVASMTAAEFGTVYDLSRYEGSLKTYKRAREAYDRFVDLMEDAVLSAWAHQD